MKTPQKKQSKPHVLGPINGNDARALLSLMMDVMQCRHSGVLWRQCLLKELCPLLGASCGVTMHAQRDEGGGLQVGSVVDHGLRDGPARLALLDRLQEDLRDNPLAVVLADRLKTAGSALVTGCREDYVSDRIWQSDALCETIRRQAKLGPLLCSVFAGPGVGELSAIVLFRPRAVHRRFGAREKNLLHLCHQELVRLYKHDQKSRRGDGLTPRQKQTLSYLTAGRSEKEIAELMSLSPHTVHDYVKVIYKRFNVASRSELLSRFIQQPG